MEFARRLESSKRTEGEAFTSMSHGRKSASKRKSYPYSS